MEPPTIPFVVPALPKAAPDSEPGNARVPRQPRGRKRVDEILDAAEALISEVGIEATTTTAIARRSGSTVGSLYHFFPSKEAIVQALARRFALLRSTPHPAASKQEAVHQEFDLMVMGLASFILERPAVSAVYDACCRNGLGVDAFREMYDVMVGQVTDYLAARLPRMPNRERGTVARFIVTVVNRVLEETHAMPRRRRAGMLRELQRMIARYTEPLYARYGLRDAVAGPGQDARIGRPPQRRAKHLPVDQLEQLGEHDG